MPGAATARCLALAARNAQGFPSSRAASSICIRQRLREKILGSMPVPEWIVPMAATLTQERFSGPEWVFERKFDGIRLLAYKNGDDVQLFSRNHLPQNLPAVGRAIAQLPMRDVILDGEITWGR